VSTLPEPGRSWLKVSAYHERLIIIIGALRLEGNMFIQDTAGIVKRLRLNVELLVQASNQLFFMGSSWPEVFWTTLQINNHIFYCMSDLGQIIEELDGNSTKTVDFGILNHLTRAESIRLSNLEDMRQKLASVWRHLEGEKQGILQAARRRAGQ